MVKSTQDVASDDATAALNGPAMWGVFVQAEMGPCRVAIRSVFLQDTPKMRLAPHDHVVKTLTSDRADCALQIFVLPWRSSRDRWPNPPREHLAISAVIVAAEKRRAVSQGKASVIWWANHCAVGFMVTPIHKMLFRPTPRMTNATDVQSSALDQKSLPLQLHRRDCAEMSSSLAKAVSVPGACISKQSTARQ
jgi:hypothetical protein